MRHRHRYRHGQCKGAPRGASIMVGFVLLVVGGLMLARQMGVQFPPYLFSWQMILVAVGLFSGLRHGFRGFGWAIPILVGSVFIVREYVPEIGYEPYIVPGLLLGIGLFIVLRNVFAKKNTSGFSDDFKPIESDSDTEDFEAHTVFGGVKKNVIHKNFKSGEVSAVFGSAEVNMLQADFDKTAYLELNAVFGSIKLIVPAHWQLKIDNNSVLGSVEDKRPQHGIYSDKVLRVEGNAVFGGIEIESH